MEKNKTLITLQSQHNRCLVDFANKGREKKKKQNTHYISEASITAAWLTLHP